MGAARMVKMATTRTTNRSRKYIDSVIIGGRYGFLSRQELYAVFPGISARKKRLDTFRPERTRVCFPSEVADITNIPLTVGLPCAIAVMVIL